MFQQLTSCLAGYLDSHYCVLTAVYTVQVRPGYLKQMLTETEHLKQYASTLSYSHIFSTEDTGLYKSVDITCIHCIFLSGRVLSAL